MPVTQLPRRVVKFSGESLPTFPNEVCITAELGPKEAFGVAPLSGKLPLHAGGQQIALSADMSHGGIAYKSKAKLPHLRQSSELFDLPIEFDGQNATVKTRLRSATAFKECIGILADHLPDFVAFGLGAPIELVDLFGTVDASPFTVEIRGQYYGAVNVLPVGRAIDAQLQDLKLLPVDAAQRVFAALRYFNQERWLAYSAPHPTRFAAERLLNIAKACEVLFSARVDDFRAALEKLSVRGTIAEILVSAIYLRNQVDVGHVRLSRLSEKELNDFHRLVVEAGAALEWLIRHTIREVLAERFRLADFSPSQDKVVMERVAAVLASIDKEHWRIVLDKSWLQSDTDAGASP